MVSRLIIHQFDPTELHPGGIDTCISDLIAYAPPDVSFAVVGANSTGRDLGQWQEIEHRGREIAFMPVARLWGKDRRRVPDSAKLSAGVVRWRRCIPAGPVQTHRTDVAAVVRRCVAGTGYIQFIHNPHGPQRGILGPGSDSFWRHAPAVYRKVERAALRGADRVVVFSDTEATRLQGAGVPAVAWRTWFDPATFYPAQTRADDSIRIACIGRLESQKDPALAVAVVHELAKRGVPVSATFLGTGSLEPELRRRVKELRIGGVVAFAGAGSRADVADLVRASRVMLLTSHYEGSPRAVIEALACGTPVAATVDADPDGLVSDRKTGANAASRSPKDLADAVLSAAECSATDCAAAVAGLRADQVVPQLYVSTELPAPLAIEDTAS